MMVGQDRRNHLEGRAIAHAPFKYTSLSRNELDHLANGHTGWKPVWVHDDVRANTEICEGQVLLGHNAPYDACKSPGR